MLRQILQRFVITPPGLAASVEGRLRLLHHKCDDNPRCLLLDTHCEECFDEYPCKTIRILDGGNVSN